MFYFAFRNYQPFLSGKLHLKSPAYLSNQASTLVGAFPVMAAISPSFPFSCFPSFTSCANSFPPSAFHSGKPSCNNTALFSSKDRCTYLMSFPRTSLKAFTMSLYERLSLTMSYVLPACFPGFDITTAATKPTSSIEVIGKRLLGSTASQISDDFCNGNDIIVIYLFIT